MKAYVQHHVDRQTDGDLLSEVAQIEEQYRKDICIYEKKLRGYHFKLIKNDTESKVLVLCQAYLNISNGLILKPELSHNNLIVSASQYVISVGPGEFKGAYLRRYEGYQAEAEKSYVQVIDETEFRENDGSFQDDNKSSTLLKIYEEFYSEYSKATDSINNENEEESERTLLHITKDHEKRPLVTSDENIYSKQEIEDKVHMYDQSHKIVLDLIDRVVSEVEEPERTATKVVTVNRNTVNL